MKKPVIINFLVGVGTILISFCTFAVEKTNVGRGLGIVDFASGPQTIIVNQDPCNYRLSLEPDQYVKLNYPAIIFAETKNWSENQGLPYFDQTEMSAGSNWTFLENNKFKSKWFGLMCEDISHTHLDSSKSDVNLDEETPEISSIKADNDLKCPATLTEKGWLPTSNAGRPGTYTFQELKGENWSGFIVAIKAKSGTQFVRINFCMVHGGNVVIGSALNNTKPSWLGQKALDEIVSTLKSIKFLP